MLKKVNRVLALMLALIMVLGTLPGIAVFAAEPDTNIGGPTSDGLASATSSEEEALIGADSENEIMPISGPGIAVASAYDDLPIINITDHNGAPKDTTNLATYIVVRELTEPTDGANGTAVITKYNFIDAGMGGVGSPTEITIPSYVTGTTSLDGNSKTYDIVEIADDAFSSSKLTSINFAEESKIAKFGANAFASNSITSLNNIPASVTTMGKGCYSSCDIQEIDLTSATSLKELPENCFSKCEKLTKITFGATVTKIGVLAFDSCNALTYVEVPSQVTEIQDRAFNVNNSVNLFLKIDNPAGSVSGAPWGNVAGYIKWADGSGYDNDSPFIINDDGYIVGLKNNYTYDNTENKLDTHDTEAAKDKNDFRYYLATGDGPATPEPIVTSTEWDFNDSNSVGKTFTNDEKYENNSKQSLTINYGTSTLPSPTPPMIIEESNGDNALVFQDAGSGQDGWRFTSDKYFPSEYTSFTVEEDFYITKDTAASDTILLRLYDSNNVTDKVSYNSSDGRFIDIRLSSFSSSKTDLLYSDYLVSSDDSKAYEKQAITSGSKISQNTWYTLKVEYNQSNHKIKFSYKEKGGSSYTLTEKDILKPANNLKTKTDSISIVPTSVGSSTAGSKPDYIKFDNIKISYSTPGQESPEYQTADEGQYPYFTVDGAKKSGASKVDDLKGKVEVKIPTKVYKTKDGSRTEEVIDIKGIADGAFSGRPAVQILKSVDFLYFTDPDVTNKIDKIPYGAFWYCDSMKNVNNIPDTVTIIEPYAFRLCRALTSIELPSQIKEIGLWAFRECRDLKTVRFNHDAYKEGDSSAPLANIDINAFSKCLNLREIYMEGVVYDPENGDNGVMDTAAPEVPAHPFGAFYANVHYKNKNEAAYTLRADAPNDYWWFNRITNDAVFYTGPIGSSVVINVPSTLTATIDGQEYTITVTGVAQPDENTPLLSKEDSDRNGTLTDRSGAKEIKAVVFPNSVKSINHSAFYQYKIDEPLNLNKVENINYRAFQDCELTSLTLPETIKTIFQYAFRGNTFASQIDNDPNLGSDLTGQYVLVVPGNIESIASDAFDDKATGIKKVVIKQYQYNADDLDDDGNPIWDDVNHLYKKATTNITSNAPFGLNKNTTTVLYMDSGAPIYFDHVLSTSEQARQGNGVAPEAKAVKQDGKVLNEAVINLGAIDVGSPSYIKEVKYVDNFTEEEHTANKNLVDNKERNWWHDLSGFKTVSDNSDQSGSPYNVNLEKIYGNGRATFTIDFSDVGTDKTDYHSIPINIFHHVQYDVNGGDGAVPVTNDLHDANNDGYSPVATGTPNDQKEEFIEGFKVPIVGNNGNGDLLNNVVKTRSAFAGWYAVEKNDSGQAVKPDWLSTKIESENEIGELGAADPNFYDYTDLEMEQKNSIDFYTMGESDVVLYAVWAVDVNGNGIPDYDDAIVNYHMNKGEWTYRGTTYKDPTFYTENATREENYSLSEDLVKPTRAAQQYEVDGGMKTIHFAQMGWATKAFEGYADSNGQFQKKGDDDFTPYEDAANYIVHTLDTSKANEYAWQSGNSGKFQYDVYAIWAEDNEPDPGTNNPGDGIPDAMQVVYKENLPQAVLDANTEAGDTAKETHAKYIPYDSHAYTSITDLQGVSVMPTDDSVKLPELPGYIFKGWSTNADYDYKTSSAEESGKPADKPEDGSPDLNKWETNVNVLYQPEALKGRDGISDTQTWFTKKAGLTTLYAVWEPVTYGVKYNVNGGSGEVPEDEKTYALGADVLLSYTPAPTHDGSLFLGWTRNKPFQSITTQKELDDRVNDETNPLYLAYNDPLDSHVHKQSLKAIMELGEYSTVMNLYAAWAVDRYGEREANGNHKGDGIPDYYQVIYDANAGAGEVDTSKLPKDEAKYNFGSGVTSVTVQDGSALTRSGYTFKGWSLNAPDGSGKNGSDLYTAGNTFNKSAGVDILYAVWEPLSPVYGVVYNGNGATSGSEPTDTEKYSEDDNFTTKTNKDGDGDGNLARDGYTFLGWSAKKEEPVTEKSKKPDIITPGAETAMKHAESGVMVLYAVWAADAYGGKDDDGNPIGDGTPDYEQVIYLPGSADYPKAPDDGRMPLPTADTIGEGEYTVKGTGVGDDPAPKLEKYTFEGWTVVNPADGVGTVKTKEYVAGAIIAKDDIPDVGLILEAKWDTEKATLTYDANGGKWAEDPIDKKTTQHEPGTTVTLGTADGVAAPTHESGYIFAGWTDKAEANGKIYGKETEEEDEFAVLPKDLIDTTITMPEENTGKTVYAVWIVDEGGSSTAAPDNTPDAYQVRYEDNVENAPEYDSIDGPKPTAANIPVDDTQYAVGDDVNIKLHANGDPTLEGYIFMGWSLNDPKHAGEADTLKRAGQQFKKSGKLDVLYAIWAKKDATYSLTYHANGGTLSSVYADDVTDIEKKGQPREGWNNVTDTVTISGITAGTTEALELEGDDTDAVGKYTNTFTKDGNLFVGWTTSVQVTNQVYGETAIPEGVNITDRVTVTNSNIDVYAIWSTNNFGAPEPGATPRPDDIPDVYQIKYDGHKPEDAPDGIDVKGVPEDYEAHTIGQHAVVAGPNPTLEGYVFKGWSLNKTDGNGKKPDGSLYQEGDQFTKSGRLDTLYAVWKKAYYVNYHVNTLSDDNKGPTYKSPAYSNGSDVTLDAEIGESRGDQSLEYTAPAGYVFVGWADNPGVQSTYDNKTELPKLVTKVTLESADKDVYAVWAQDNYSTNTDKEGETDGIADAFQVRYVKGTADEVSDLPNDRAQYKIGEKVYVRSMKPTTFGAHFLGWTLNGKPKSGELPDPGTGVVYYSGDDTFDKNGQLDVLTAQWDNMPTVNYHMSGGTWNKDGKDYNESTPFTETVEPNESYALNTDVKPTHAPIMTVTI